MTAKSFSAPMKAVIIMMLIILGGAFYGQSQDLYEDFNYTPPAFIGGNGNAGSSSNNWTTHSVTSGQTTTIDVQNNNLSIAGLQSPTGYMVQLPGSNSTVSRDVNRALTITGSTFAYYSVLINVIDNTQIGASFTDNGYFMSFGGTSGTSVTTIYSRLHIKSTNSGTTYRLGIQNSTGGTPTQTEYPTDLSFGTTYLIVVKHDFNGTNPDISTLWVNPTSIGGSEPTGGVTNSSGTTGQSAFGSICLRNASATPKVNIDEIRVGTTWASVTPYNQIDWANLQWPPTGTISLGNPYAVYAQVWEPGVTDQTGQGAGISAWIGYSTTNTDPSGTGWTWIPAVYNLDVGNNDEYMADMGVAIPSPGSYYMASRFQYGSAPYVYGGYGTGFWNGTSSVSATLTVNPPEQIDWANLQWPPSGNINSGGAYNVYDQVYEAAVTAGAGQGSGISAWIGYSTSNTNPNTWTNWVPAAYNSDAGNNDEYVADLAAGIPAGTYYYASRFKMGLADYVYGGFSGGFWDGTSNVSGVLSVAPWWTSGWPKAENPSSSGFVAKASLDYPGTAYFVVLPSGAPAPSPAQVKAGQNAAGTLLAANLRGNMVCSVAGTEYTVNVLSLSGSTTYDVYFTAEGTSGNLQTNVTLKSVTTLTAATAPVVSSPVYSSVVNTSAVLGGTVDSDGGSPITERGTVWNTSSGVTIANHKLAEGGTTTGAFTHTRTGLPHGSHIFFKAYATNAVATTLSSESSFFTLSNEPTTHVSGFSATAASSTSINLNWTVAATGADGYLILMKTGSTPSTGEPADATAYTAGAAIGDGTVAAIIIPGSSLSTTITGLTATTQYSFTIFPYASDGVNAPTFNYLTSPVVPSATATTPATPGITYTWNVAAGNWTTPTSWTPDRTTPLANDILIFDGAVQASPSVTLDFVSPVSIGVLQVKNNAAVNFSVSDAARTLNIGGTGGPAPQFEIQAGSSLTVSATNALTLFVSTGFTGSISGSLIFSGAAHKLNAADAGAIVFNNGSALVQGTGCSGNVFTNTGTASVVSFNAGSTFIMKGAGSNPFGLSAPASKVVFQTGSLYKHKSANTPSFSGRTYANFELDTLNITLTATGGSATSVDNLTITNGTLNFNMTATPGHSIKGNIYIAPTGTLNFNPASAGTFNLNGTTTQTITAAGTLAFGANSTFVVNNASGITLLTNVTMNHVTLTEGLVNPGSNIFTVNGNLNGGSATAYVNGKLARPFTTAPTSKIFIIGKGGNYRLITFGYTALDAASTVTIEQIESAMSGTIPANTTLYISRYWTITQTGASTYTYDLTLDGTGFTPVGSGVILKNTGGTVTSHTATVALPFYSTTGLSSLSDFALGDYVIPPSVTAAPASLSGFSYVVGAGPSAEQNFNVSGTYLTGSILLTAPANYEISTTSGSGFGSMIAIMPGTGTVPSTPIYVRLKAGLAAGTYNNEDIVITSTGAPNVTVTCNGVVLNPQLSAGTLAAFGPVCINTTAGPQSFTISGTELTTANVTVGPLTAYTFATASSGPYTSSLSISQPGGTFSATIYVKFTPTLVQSYNGNIPVGGGGALGIIVAASGSGVNTLPSVLSVTPATSVTGTTATCSGNVTDQGCQSVTARGICYGTSANPDISGLKTTETGTTGAFSSNITGLIPVTTYHYRAYATSSSGTAYGADYTFTTLAIAPTVVTTAATAIFSSGATLTGTVNANNSSTTVTFEYGLTTAYGTSVSAVPATVTGTSVTPASYLLGGLQPNTTYHYRIVGANVAGTTYGLDMTFTTSAVPPVVSTNAASAITANSATLNGTVNANNAATTATFDFGTSTLYGTVYTAAQSPVSGNTPVAITYNASGLAPNTTYWFKANGSSIGGSASGSDLSFTTGTLAPTVVTTAATGIGSTTATLNGTVNANNQSSSVTIEWGLTTSYGNTVTPTPATVTGYTVTPVSYSLAGLIVNTTYHYRVVATNTTGTTYGNDMTFTTGCPPPDPAGTITGPASVCQLTNGVTYTVGTINNATGYVWTVPTGVTIVSGSGSNSITVNFGTSATSGNVSVYGTGICGNGTPSNLAVTVNPLPVPVINGPATVCAGPAGIGYSTDPGMMNYVWTVSAGGTLTGGGGPVTYDNGPLVNSPGTGPGGADESVIVTGTNSFGFNNSITANFSVADDFTIAQPWSVNTIDFFGYQTGSTTTSTFTGLYVRIWNGNPGAGGTVVWGDLTTNRMASTSFTNIYRVNAVNGGTTRPIMKIVANTPGLNLSPGTYWLEWTATGSLASGPWVPPVTINGQPTTGNAIQYNGTTWSAIVSGAGPTYPQGLPFTIHGTTGSNAITVVWNTPGAQSVTVTYNTPAGCTPVTPTTLNVNVNARPTPTITGSANACQGFSNNIYSTEAGMGNYNWTISAGGTINSGAGTNAINVTWNTVGAKTVSVNYTTPQGCDALTPALLNVNVNSIPTPSITGPNQLCSGATSATYTTQPGFSSYSWSISYGGIITSGLGTNQVTVDWSLAGQRWIAVNYSNSSGCSAVNPISYNVSILPAPVPTISGPATVCQAITESYTTESLQSNYVWQVSSGGTIMSGAGTNSITVKWIGAGAQTVSVNYSNEFGCQATNPAVLNVTVDPLPAPAGAITGTGTVCSGTMGVIYSVSPVANATGYVWSLPPGATIASGSNTNSITVDFAANATTGIVKVYGTNACGSGTVSPNFAVTVKTAPTTPVITQHGDTLISTAASGNQWYKDGNPIPGATDQKYVVTENGTYYVIVSSNGCSSAPSNSIMILNVGTGALNINSTFEVFPNPNLGEFDLKVTSQKRETFSIEVFNNIGELVWRQDRVIIDGLYNTHINLEGVPSGIYLVSLRNDQMNIVRKVVIMD